MEQNGKNTFKSVGETADGTGTDRFKQLSTAYDDFGGHTTNPGRTYQESQVDQLIEEEMKNENGQYVLSSQPNENLSKNSETSQKIEAKPDRYSSQKVSQCDNEIDQEQQSLPNDTPVTTGHQS